jgi:adenosylhomocysteine nucleosidase
MRKILVTYAVAGERVAIDWPDCRIEYLQTGIGKVKSAFHLAEAINEYCPDIVLNIGTAGTVSHNLGDIFVCRRFVDRDMMPLRDLGLEYEIKSSDDSATCNTGDSFMTDTEGAVDGDVFDMESYAQAYVCREKSVPFISVKYVTDIIGRNSVKHWEDKLADARAALTLFFKSADLFQPLP